MKIVWIVLAALTVVAVGVAAWFYVRDEYAFQDVGSGDVVALTIDIQGDSGRVFGYIDDPPSDFPSWMRGWERDTSGESAETDTVVTVILDDGRRVRLDVGGQRGYATWIGVDGTTGETVAVHFNDSFVWYLAGVRAGLSEWGRVVPGSEQSSSPSPSPSSPTEDSPSPTEGSSSPSPDPSTAADD